MGGIDGGDFYPRAGVWTRAAGAPWPAVGVRLPDLPGMPQTSGLATAVTAIPAENVTVITGVLTLPATPVYWESTDGTWTSPPRPLPMPAGYAANGNSARGDRHEWRHRGGLRIRPAIWWAWCGVAAPADYVRGRAATSRRLRRQRSAQHLARRNHPRRQRAGELQGEGRVGPGVLDTRRERRLHGAAAARRSPARMAGLRLRSTGSPWSAVRCARWVRAPRRRTATTCTPCPGPGPSAGVTSWCATSAVWHQDRRNPERGHQRGRYDRCRWGRHGIDQVADAAVIPPRGAEARQRRNPGAVSSPTDVVWKWGGPAGPPHFIIDLDRAIGGFASRACEPRTRRAAISSKVLESSRSAFSLLLGQLQRLELTVAERRRRRAVVVRHDVRRRRELARVHVRRTARRRRAVTASCTRAPAPRPRHREPQLVAVLRLRVAVPARAVELAGDAPAARRPHDRCRAAARRAAAGTPVLWKWSSVKQRPVVAVHAARLADEQPQPGLLVAREGARRRVRASRELGVHVSVERATARARCAARTRRSPCRCSRTRA